jgi:hypothetical protein
MENIDQPTPDTEKLNAQVSVKFPKQLRGFDIDLAGIMSGDRETGAFQVESKEGTFIFLPPESRFTGKRKRRLNMLYNL